LTSSHAKNTQAHVATLVDVRLNELYTHRESQKADGTELVV